MGGGLSAAGLVFRLLAALPSSLSSLSLDRLDNEPRDAGTCSSGSTVGAISTTTAANKVRNRKARPSDRAQQIQPGETPLPTCLHRSPRPSVFASVVFPAFVTAGDERFTGTTATFRLLALPFLRPLDSEPKPLSSLPLPLPLPLSSSSSSSSLSSLSLSESRRLRCLVTAGFFAAGAFAALDADGRARFSDAATTALFFRAVLFLAPSLSLAPTPTQGEGGGGAAAAAGGIDRHTMPTRTVAHRELMTHNARDAPIAPPSHTAHTISPKKRHAQAYQRQQRRHWRRSQRRRRLRRPTAPPCT